MARLSGKTAWITGASAGIGAASAAQLAAEGARVVLGARRVDRLERLAAALKDAHGAEALAVPLDVTCPESRAAFVEAAEAFGPADILVNNAGLAKGKDTIVDAAAEDWDTMLSTNVQGLFHLTRAALPGIIAREGADIVMIGSIAGLDPYAGGGMYCASKAALQAFSKALRVELLGKDIRVFVIDPGLVDTEFSTVRLGAEAASGVYDGINALTADDIADCVTFAVTRRRAVSVDHMLVLCTDQVDAHRVHRRG